MDWNGAIEKNTEALRRILAMLIAMVGVVGDGADPQGNRPKTLPRHLHRFVLRLLRPAEIRYPAADHRRRARAGGEIRPWRTRKPTPKKPPLNRKNGYGTGIVIRPGPLPEWAQGAGAEAVAQPVAAAARPAQALRRPPPLCEAGRHAADQGSGRRPIVPFFRQPRTAAPATADRKRSARCDAHPPPARGDRPGAGRSAAAGAAVCTVDGAAGCAAGKGEGRGRSPAVGHPLSVSGFALATSPPLRGGEEIPSSASAVADLGFLAPAKWGRGGEGEARDGEGDIAAYAAPPPAGAEASLEDLGISPEVLALCRARRSPAQSNIITAPDKPRRFRRLSPMRPGRPPGWRKRPTHEVHEVLNELHGLAVWARDGP